MFTAFGMFRNNVLTIVHRTCPPVGTHQWLWVPSITITGRYVICRCCYFSSLPQQRAAIGQFACLLQSLDLVAVSQAPSPESNPNSPYSLIP